MGRSVLQPTSRLLNPGGMFHSPGERALARDLFSAIGCRVLDPQEEEGPADLGPAANPDLIIFVDPSSTDLIDNVIYASEIEPAQCRLEPALREEIENDAPLRARCDEYQACFTRHPQGMTEVGVATNAKRSTEAFERITGTPELMGRLQIAGPFRPGEAGSVDPRVIQEFIRTDVVSTGFLLAGPHRLNHDRSLA